MCSDIKQAVVLAGGLGTRLMPLTKSTPKPMVEVNGKPFLEHLVIQLKAQGFKSVLLLTGYLHEKIAAYFGNGEKFGIDIQYSQGAVDWDTGRRIYRAKDLLDNHFFLLYGDNYLNYNFEKLKEFYSQQKLPLSLVVTEKKTGNIRLDENSRVELYDSTRKAAGLNHVELGFMIVRKEIVELINDEKNPSFSATLKALSDERQVAAYWEHDKYYSISDLQRLKLTEEYLTSKKLLLIDRDGTINKKATKAFYITEVEDFEILPESLEAMKKLARQGYRFIVVTNQAGLSTGDLDRSQLDAIHQKMLTLLKEEGIVVEDIYFSDAHWQDKTNWRRKPNPGMFYDISEKYKLNLADTYYIGDDPRDMDAAYNSNSRGIFLGDQDRLEPLQLRSVVYASTAMNDIADYILKGI